MKLVVDWLNPAQAPDPDTGSIAAIDTFEGPSLSYITEPSGALIIFEGPAKEWAAYAPGVWTRVSRG